MDVVLNTDKGFFLFLFLCISCNYCNTVTGIHPQYPVSWETGTAYDQ